VNSYIVRVYRQGKDDLNKFVGIVEEVGVTGRKAFTDLDELWEILNPHEAYVHKDAKERVKRKYKNHKVKSAQ
jgi:hypothetical protein